MSQLSKSSHPLHLGIITRQSLLVADYIWCRQLFKSIVFIFSKMSVLAYKDNSIRVVVSTANLVESDWENRTQGLVIIYVTRQRETVFFKHFLFRGFLLRLWISPKLPPLPPGADTLAGESTTQFKADLLRYLSAYRLPQLQEWIGRIQRADFTSVR